MIYIFRVTTGQEKIVSQMLEKKTMVQSLGVHSILVPENVKGYIFVEVASDEDAAKLAHNTRHVKGMLKKNITIEEIEKMITVEKPASMVIEVGDIVEIKSGPFKGEKARVTKVDENKDELVVEFVEMAVPIPTTIKTKIVKLFRKADCEL